MVKDELNDDKWIIEYYRLKHEIRTWNDFDDRTKIMHTLL
jgi:hypothetical protein